MEKYKILVVEDTPKHQDAAKSLLADHDLTIVPDFNSAVDLLVGKLYRNFEGKKEFDVVLTDLMYEGRGLSTRDPGEQGPFGYPTALVAAQVSVPYVGVVTDMNHHQSGLAYSFDYLRKGFKENQRPDRIMINKSQVMFFDIRSLRSLYSLENGGYGGFPKTSDEKEKYVKDDSGQLVSVKNWQHALEILIGEEHPLQK